MDGDFRGHDQLAKKKKHNVIWYVLDEYVAFLPRCSAPVLWQLIGTKLGVFNQHHHEVGEVNDLLRHVGRAINSDSSVDSAVILCLWSVCELFSHHEEQVARRRLAVVEVRRERNVCVAVDGQLPLIVRDN